MSKTIAALAHTPIAYKNSSATVELCFSQLGALCDPFDDKKTHALCCAHSPTHSGVRAPFDYKEMSMLTKIMFTSIPALFTAQAVERGFYLRPNGAVHPQIACFMDHYSDTTASPLWSMYEQNLTTKRIIDNAAVAAIFCHQILAQSDPEIMPENVVVETLIAIGKRCTKQCRVVVQNAVGVYFEDKEGGVQAVRCVCAAF